MYNDPLPEFYNFLNQMLVGFITTVGPVLLFVVIVFILVYWPRNND